MRALWNADGNMSFVFGSGVAPSPLPRDFGNHGVGCCVPGSYSLTRETMPSDNIGCVVWVM